MVELTSSKLAARQDPAPAEDSPSLQLTLVLMGDGDCHTSETLTAFRDSGGGWSQSPLSKAELT